MQSVTHVHAVVVREGDYASVEADAFATAAGGDFYMREDDEFENQGDEGTVTRQEEERPRGRDPALPLVKG